MLHTTRSVLAIALGRIYRKTVSIDWHWWVAAGDWCPRRSITTSNSAVHALPAASKAKGQGGLDQACRALAHRFACELRGVAARPHGPTEALSAQAQGKTPLRSGRFTRRTHLLEFIQATVVRYLLPQQGPSERAVALGARQSKRALYSTRVPPSTGRQLSTRGSTTRIYDHVLSAARCKGWSICIWRVAKGCWLHCVQPSVHKLAQRCTAAGPAFGNAHWSARTRRVNSHSTTLQATAAREENAD